MTPAERLIAAADLLDKRAGEATEGPWNVDGPWWWGDTCAAMVTAGLARDAVVIAPQGATDANTRYIATMHPEVGRAVAKVIRAYGEGARELEQILTSIPVGPGRSAMLDLADLVLAGAS